MSGFKFPGTDLYFCFMYKTIKTKEGMIEILQKANYSWRIRYFMGALLLLLGIVIQCQELLEG